MSATNNNYHYSSSPSSSVFNKLADLFDRALDLESVIEHPAPYPRISRRKSCRQLRDQEDFTMSSSYPYNTRPIAPYGCPTTPISSYSSSPSSPYQQYHYNNSPVSSSRQPVVPIEYVCLMPNCRYAAARKADLERHYAAMHIPAAADDMYDCQVSGCHRKGSYGFKRKDKMVDHMREVHKVDIPRRTSVSTSSRRVTSGSDYYYPSYR